MNKTILVTMVALAAVAMAAIPTASACQASDPTVNYVACGSQKYEDVNAVVEYVGDGVELILEIVDHAT